MLLATLVVVVPFVACRAAPHSGPGLERGGVCGVICRRIYLGQAYQHPKDPVRRDPGDAGRGDSGHQSGARWLGPNARDRFLWDPADDVLSFLNGKV